MPVHSSSCLLIYDIYIIVFGFQEAEQAHKEVWHEFTLLKFYMIAKGHQNKDVSFISEQINKKYDCHETGLLGGGNEQGKLY